MVAYKHSVIPTIDKTKNPCYFHGIPPDDLTLGQLMTPEVYMKCQNLTKHGYPCRKCPICLDKKLRSWLLRLQLEALLYPDEQVTFLTLTYDNDHLPADAEASKRSIQLWFKRLRKQHKVRYVAALEKGKKATQRFHWHCVLFGLNFDAYNRQMIKDTWMNGYIDWKPCSPGRMHYVLKYTLKDGVFLRSTKPGLGHDAIPLLQNMLDKMTHGEISKLHGIVASGSAQNDPVNIAQHGLTFKLSRLKVGKYDYPVHDYINKRLNIPWPKFSRKFYKQLHEERYGTPQKKKD
jgi:hypothetical protein